MEGVAPGSGAEGGVTEGRHVSYTGIHGLFGYIIRHGHATHWELNHIYSLEDAYDIWEADYVKEVNDHLDALRRYNKAMRDAKRQG